MKKLLLLSSALFCALLFSSFKNNEGDKTPHCFVTKDGDTVQISGDPVIDSQYLTYSDGKNKSHVIPQSKIKIMFIGSRQFINLPILSLGMTRLQEVIATSKNYYLTIYLDNNGYYMYIWNKKFENKEDKIWIGRLYNETFYTTGKTQQKVMEKYLRKYFGSCKELIAAMNENIEAKKMLSDGISNYQCIAPATQDE